MGGISKSFSLLLILILAVSILTMVKPAFAQSNDVNDTVVPPPNGDNISTPSIPEFTVQVVNSSNFVLIITNQPFTPFNDINGNPVQFFYSVRVGPLNASIDSNWTELYDADGGYPTQSKTQTTTITINLADGNNEYGEQNPVPVNSQFLVEVEAIIGFYGRDAAYGPLAPYVVYGETSGWSNAQTITIPVNTPLRSTPAPSSSTSTLTPAPTSTAVSSASNASLLLIITIALVAIVFLLVVIISLLLYMKKRRIA